MVPPLKSFPVDWENAVLDAATAWSKPGGVADSTFLSEGSAWSVKNAAMGDWRETTNESFGGPIHGPAYSASFAATGGAPNVDSGMMPFDMDVPVAYSITNACITGGIPNAIVKNELVAPGYVPAGTSGEDKDEMDRFAVVAAAMMENIETDRIPCPRLCGATFSFGVGGLAGECMRINSFQIRDSALWILCWT